MAGQTGAVTLREVGRQRVSVVPAAFLPALTLLALVFGTVGSTVDAAGPQQVLSITVTSGR